MVKKRVRLWSLDSYFLPAVRETKFNRDSGDRTQLYYAMYTTCRYGYDRASTADTGSAAVNAGRADKLLVEAWTGAN